MYRKFLLAAGAADLLVLSWLDRMAFRGFYYWRHPYFDALMHLWGGLAIGFMSTALYLRQERERPLSLCRLAVWNAVSAVAVGVVWEGFEFWFDRIVVFSPIDTARDLGFGLAGSLLAGILSGIMALWIRARTANK